MFRSTITVLMAGLMALSLGSALVAEAGGQRIERRDDGFAVTFPSDWSIEEVRVIGDGAHPDEPRTILETSTWDPGARRLLDALTSCQVLDMTRPARAAGLTSAQEFAWAWELLIWTQAEGISEFDATVMVLPAGQTACLDLAFEFGPELRQYVFTDGESWFALVCYSTQPPEDRWLPIAESFEFLPAAE